MSASSDAPRPRSATTSALLLVLTGAALIAYPVLAWLILSRFGASAVGMLLMAMFAPRLISRSLRLRSRVLRDQESWLAAAMVALGAGAVILGRLEAAMLAPSVINLALAAAFGATLLGRGPPMIERFARRIHEDLRPPEVAWCRRWTWIWLGFFVGNASLISALAHWAPFEWWVGYTGLGAYIAVGLLVSAEIVLRKQRFGFRRAEVLDRWLLERFPALPERADGPTTTAEVGA